MTPRDAYLRRTYQITEEEYDALAAVMAGKCWICGAARKTRRLHLDHDHKKRGRESVRGILCARCNRGLVFYRDNPAVMRNAAVYLESDLAQQILAGGRLPALTTNRCPS